MDLIILLIAIVSMWGISSALMDWMDNTPAKKKRKYIRTVDDIHKQIDKL